MPVPPVIFRNSSKEEVLLEVTSATAESLKVSELKEGSDALKELVGRAAVTETDGGGQDTGFGDRAWGARAQRIDRSAAD